MPYFLFLFLFLLFLRVLVSRIVYLIKNKKIKPENILAVTFTKKAAKEMKNRLDKIFTENNPSEDHGPNSGISRNSNF